MKGGSTPSGRPCAVVTVLAPGAPANAVAALPQRMARWVMQAQSHRGGRARNEDRSGAWCSDDAALLVLADGMGGHPQGDVAADLAVRRIGARFAEDACPELVVPRIFLLAAFMDAHDALIGYGQSLGGSDQPRTTLVAALVQQGQLWWSHCGDSRLYVVRDGQLLVRTRDHSYAELNALLEAEPGLAGSTSRHVLFSCIGSPGRPLIDSAGPLDLLPGDRLLLCSDGLWEGLDDDTIVAELSASDLGEAVGVLVRRALRAGGDRCDNVTVLALSWDVDTEP
jgi:serine/threonine protein phosphatase PrpC